MDEHGLYAKRIGNAAGVLPASTAKASERILRHIISARDADLADGIGHIVDRNVEETLCNFSQGKGGFHCGLDAFQCFARCIGIKRLIAMFAKDIGEELRVNPAQKGVAIGDGQGTTFAIAGRARVCASAVWPHAKARAIKAANRAATGCNRVNMHHWRSYSDARNHAVAGQLKLASIMRDIGAGSAHVETDQPLIA